jgi:Mor family transcriptional regulator
MSEAPQILRNQAFRQRNLQIMRERLDGETYTAIAKRYGLTPTRIRGIVLNLIGKDRRMKLPHHRLPDDIAAKLKELGHP